MTTPTRYEPRRGPWMQLASGEPFDLDAPDLTNVTIRDIAWSLARIQRWTGHALTRCSVAEHSVVVCDIAMQSVPKQARERVGRVALLHDAHEAFVGDVASPLKQMLELRAPGIWASIVSPIDAAIADRFGIDMNDPQTVAIKHADGQALAIERDLCLSRSRRPWSWQPSAPGPDVAWTHQGLDPEAAYGLFMQRARTLFLDTAP